MDEAWMKRAIELAQLGKGFTKLNPLVGAVIVKDGLKISEGYHRAYGLDHAERDAIKNANVPLEGATIYVNLEPCCHYGKTPPCTEAIIENKFSRVVIGCLDSFDKVSGKGVEQLRAAGIEVDVGVLEEEARALNRAFFTRLHTNRPYIISKIAMSLDGKTATSGGESQWITSKESREDAHRQRGQVDGILIGANTAILDNPSLTNRSGTGAKPVRIVLDSKLRIDKQAKLLTDKQAQTMIFTASTDQEKIEAITSDFVSVYQVPRTKKGLDLHRIMDILYEQALGTILVEGGSEVHGSFLTEGLIDEVVVYIAPMILGGRSAKTAVGGEGIATLTDALKLDSVEIEPIGVDYKLTGRRLDVYGSR